MKKLNLTGAKHLKAENLKSSSAAVSIQSNTIKFPPQAENTTNPAADDMVDFSSASNLTIYYYYW